MLIKYKLLNQTKRIFYWTTWQLFRVERKNNHANRSINREVLLESRLKNERTSRWIYRSITPSRSLSSILIEKVQYPYPHQRYLQFPFWRSPWSRQRAWCRQTKRSWPQHTAAFLPLWCSLLCPIGTAAVEDLGMNRKNISITCILYP